MIDFETIAKAPVATEPFSYFACENVLSADTLKAVGADFPQITRPGIFTLSDLTYGPNFARLIHEINAPELEDIMQDKFGVDLSDKPIMITIRGHCQRKDGRIHTDSKDKIVTCLLYLNDPVWGEQGGRLRLLRNGEDLNSTIAEVG
ncbi:MAG: 2OG-Fe(II) oxygenase, partial [Alphaproteobacteria bacterium]|nr:2OG-Fe(II) oxygenase [Alphaproteobacteria bacterium]